ncbi:putative XRE-type DNA-binding protein [Oxalobacteraceae bacterium GrIS 2.11]
MSKQRFTSVWDAIEDTPEEAENMKLRSALMTILKNHLNRTEISQADAAKLFGVTQPRVSDLMRGKINLFGLDALVNMVSAAGLHIEMRVLESAGGCELNSN